jgi:hypothetical protein
VLWLIAQCGCGGYSGDDVTANQIAARHEMRTLEMCDSDDAGICTPSIVRAHARLAYCANVRELATHGQAIPDAGIACGLQ